MIHVLKSLESYHFFSRAFWKILLPMCKEFFEFSVYMGLVVLFIF